MKCPERPVFSPIGKTISIQEKGEEDENGERESVEQADKKNDGRIGYGEWA